MTMCDILYHGFLLSGPPFPPKARPEPHKSLICQYHVSKTEVY